MNLSIFGPFSLRNLKHKPGKVSHQGFTATLLRQGVAVASIDADGLGPDDDFVLEFRTQGDQDFFIRRSAELVKDGFLTRWIAECHLEDLEAQEAFIRLLADTIRQVRKMEPELETRTFFRTLEDPFDSWSVINAPYRRALARKLRTQFPRVLILNEELAGA